MKIKQLEQTTIHNLLSGGTALRIPDYQRPYTWKDWMVAEFFEDIASAMERGESEYFLGSLIFVSPTTAEFEILDGQQRLTTSIILLAMLRDALHDSHPKLSQTIQTSYLLHNGVPTLRTRSEDHSAFRRVFLSDGHRVVDSDLSRLPKAFSAAVSTFHSLIETELESDKEFPKRLLDFFLHHVHFVIMVTDEISSAYTIFETINNRGTALEAKDLLKNYLLKELYEYCQKQSNDPTAQKALFEQETEEFRSNWQRAESSIIPLNDALILHREACTGVRTRKDLFKEITLLIREQKQQPIAFMDDWLRSIEAYQSLVQGELFQSFSNTTRNTIRLLQSSGNRYWQPVLVAAVRDGYASEDIEKLVYELERWIALSRIAGFAATKLRDPSLQIVRAYLHEKKPIEQIHIFIEQFLSKFRIGERAFQNLMGDCYNQSWCRYVLAKYEYELADASVDRTIPFDRTVQIEHILPLRMTATQWTALFDPQSHDRLVNTIGNLTLLIGNARQLKSSKNQQASNKPFAEKLRVYLGLAQNDGVSAFHMTSGLSGMNEWTPEVIEKRQKKMVQALAKTWGISEEQIEQQAEEYKEAFAQEHSHVSFEEGSFTDSELEERLRITLSEDSTVIPRFVVMLKILLIWVVLMRDDLRDQMFEAGVGDNIGQTGRFMSNISQLLTKTGNEHLRQLIQFDADVRVGAKKDGYTIPSQYRSLIARVLYTIQPI